MFLRGSPKSDEEKRWELLTWGVVFVSVAIIYAIARGFNYWMLVVSGAVLLGSAVFQDVQRGWTVSWLTYALGILVLGTGVAGVVNELLGGLVQVQWWVVVLMELGAVFIVKAFYDPLR